MRDARAKKSKRSLYYNASRFAQGVESVDHVSVVIQELIVVLSEHSDDRESKGPFAPRSRWECPHIHRIPMRDSSSEST